MSDRNAEYQGPVVIRFPTIMDGIVLRWYRSVEAAEGHKEVCSASRRGVRWEKDAPADWVNTAEVVALALISNRDLDTSRWETHTKSLFGPVVPRRIGSSGSQSDRSDT